MVQRQVRPATRKVLNYCKEIGLDAVKEFERLFDESPDRYKPYLIDIFDPKVTIELKRLRAFPYKLVPKPAWTAKWLIRQLSPPLCWTVARQLGRVVRPPRGVR